MTEIVTVIAHARAKAGSTDVPVNCWRNWCCRRGRSKAVSTTIAPIHGRSARLCLPRELDLGRGFDTHARSEHLARFRKKCGEVLEDRADRFPLGEDSF